MYLSILFFVTTTEDIRSQEHIVQNGTEQSFKWASITFIPLHSLCRKRLYVVLSAHDKDDGKLKPRHV